MPTSAASARPDEAIFVASPEPAEPRRRPLRADDPEHNEHTGRSRRRRRRPLQAIDLEKADSALDAAGLEARVDLAETAAPAHRSEVALTDRHRRKPLRAEEI